MVREINLDMVIFGGGVAGLWTLYKAGQKGYSSLLVESDSLGSGQTIVSQGIIHGGFKYLLPHMTREDSAHEIRNMPELWRGFLSGKDRPDLRGVIRSDSCYVWIPNDVPRGWDRALSLGTRILSTKPKISTKNPEWLEKSASRIYSLDEPIVDTSALLYQLALPNIDRIIYSDNSYLEFNTHKKDQIDYITLKDKMTDDMINVIPKKVIFTAGKGNQDLAQKIGLKDDIMQKKIIRHAIVYGDSVPAFYGHCIGNMGGAYMTITTHNDFKNRNVWNIGGDIADKGAEMSSSDFSGYIAREISRKLPYIDLGNFKISCFNATKAEVKTTGMKRPKGISFIERGNVIIGWPTKLALAPVFADKLISSLCFSPEKRKEDFPFKPIKPIIAKAPWEVENRE